MQGNKVPPYPTPTEIIRTIATAFDIKSAKKSLDDKALEKNVDYRRLEDFIKESILDPIQKHIDPGIAGLISEKVKYIFSEYIGLIGNISADGIPRDQMLPLLMQHFFSAHASSLLVDINKKIGGPSPVELIAINDPAVAVVLEWIENHESGWPQFIQGIDKEKRDRMSAWHRGSDLPSSQYIYLLQGWSKDLQLERIDWPRVRTLLLIARAIDYANKKATGLALQGKNTDFDLYANIRILQKKCQTSMSEILPVIANLQEGLRTTTIKSESDKEKLYLSIQIVKVYQDDKKEHEAIGYWLDWHEARWHVLSGNIKKSCELYKRAFEGCLYRAGQNQQFIINEALVVAASLKSPDKVFLKHLKNASVTFKYDLPSANSTAKLFKTSELIENWEIDLWKSHFNTVFPQHGLFPNTKYQHDEPRLGPLILSDIDSVEPDYRFPGRTIKVGDTWKKSMPQIVFFTECEKVDIVEKLIKKGVDINVFSDSGDTPILMALEALNVTKPGRSLDDKLFKLISQKDHDAETINKRTQKLRLLPLISAVESGRLEVVRKILEMGAEPNLRGKTDELTPLSVCIKYVGMLKNPDKFLDEQMAMPDTPEVLDSIRRRSSGKFGFTLEQQQEFLNKARNNRHATEFEKDSYSLIVKNVLKYMSLDTMRDIAKLLLEYGADPNAEDASPVKGYTPLMLAAENDERNLFELMLVNNGDPAKIYIDSRTAGNIDCWEIAEYFKSKNVMIVLEDIKHHFR